MLTLFEEHTKQLTDYEINTLLPAVLSGIKKYIGKENAITSDMIVTRMRSKGYKITGVRLRKIIHFIREHALIVCLVGGSNGYYVSRDRKDIMDQIDSLRGRESSIRSVRIKLEESLKS